MANNNSTMNSSTISVSTSGEFCKTNHRRYWGCGTPDHRNALYSTIEKCSKHENTPFEVCIASENQDQNSYHQLINSTSPTCPQCSNYPSQAQCLEVQKKNENGEWEKISETKCTEHKGTGGVCEVLIHLTCLSISECAICERRSETILRYTSGLDVASLPEIPVGEDWSTDEFDVSGESEASSSQGEQKG